jgi:hypothetical protein
MKYQPTDQEREAIALIKNEVTNWEQGEVNITDKVGFKMKNIVRNCRKNYFGVFDEEKDPTTNRYKVFIPLTEWIVESIVKNIDIDTAEIRVKAKNPKSYGVAAVFRYILQHFLDKIRFGKIINSILRLTAIDGTCFVKTWRDGKELKVRIIDTLNIIADPSANDLKDTPITERHFMSLPDFLKEGKDWTNTEEVHGTKDINRAGGSLDNWGNIASEIPMVSVYERYGWMPKFILTGNEKDKEKYVYGVIVVSGLDYGESIFHYAKEVKRCPYTIFRFKEIWNRLSGRGVGEMLYSLNAYVNEIVNARINRHRVTQLGLWKMRGGVTPQSFSKMFTTYGIKLKSQRDDIEPLQMPPQDQTTYTDEIVGKKWSMDVAGIMDQNEVTASTPATNALIQERQQTTRANLVKENLGFALEELIEDHFIPIIQDILTAGDIVRITGNPSDLERLQKKFIENEVYNKAAEYMAQGKVLLPEMIDQEIQRLTDQLNQQGEDRFVRIDRGAFDTDFNIDVQIGEEKLNPALLAQSITQALSVAAQFPNSRVKADEGLREIFDALGLDGERMIGGEEEVGQAQARQAAMEKQQKLGGVGQGVNEAALNPTPLSRPVA